jgi:penicillin-binding protein 1A
VVSILGIGLVGFLWIWIAPCMLGGCAPLDDLADYQAEGSELLDMNGVPFAHLATVNRRIVSLDSIPPYLGQAFVAIEDQRFYRHGGVDLWRTAGALLNNLRSGEIQEGGSTITQQLARNLFPEWLPYTQRNLRRKILEARVARQLERTFSKEKILELYVNHIYLGSGAYGIEAASIAYFGKAASELTLPEAATLAGLPQAPSQINPKENVELATERRNVVLERMADAGYISVEEAVAASADPVVVVSGEPRREGPESSYFVEQVRRELEERVGNRFYTAGLKIHTTLDQEAQQAAEQQLERQLSAIESGGFGTYRHPSYSQRSEANEGSNYLQGAVVILDGTSGEVRALVGGRDFNDSKFNRATQALRQAGSAFKPFIYAAALERYRSPIHQLEDEPLRITLTGGQVWEPSNYTGAYDGPITMREALTRSKNTATVRLAMDIGISSAVRVARDLGITSDIPDVPATALGAADVRPIELVAAYSAFGNGGERVDPHLIREIVDRDGQVLWSASGRRQQVLDPAVAFVLTSILRDVVDRGTGTAVRAVGFQAPAAGKTGTTNDASDAWFIGYTPDLVAGVWIGLDQPETIVRGASGGTLAAPVWGRMMRQIYQSHPTPEPWREPSGVVTAEVYRSTGMVVDEACPAQGPTYTEYFIRSTPPQQYCPLPDYRYLYGDTIWADEEWRYFLYDSLGVYYDSLAPNIDWPELDALRRRARGDEYLLEDELELARDSLRMPGDTLSLPGLLGAPPRGELPGMPGMRQPPGGIPAAGPDTLADPAEDTVPRSPPRLLGVPTQPDGGGGSRQ